MSKINEYNGSHSASEIKINGGSSQAIASAKNQVIAAFNEVKAIHSSIKNDIKWEGASEAKYQDGKTFIDMFMRDFPGLFEELETQVNNTTEIVDDLCGGSVSNKVKEYGNNA